MKTDLAPTKDHKGVFVSMYQVITSRALSEMQNYISQGKFKEAEFEGKLAINFANKYFEAYDNLVEGNIAKIPEPWRFAFDSGRVSQAEGYPKKSIVEITALSMNAHIIHDLPLTLKEIGFNPKDKELDETFDRFNKVLYEEKNNILNSIAPNYGSGLSDFQDMVSKTEPLMKKSMELFFQRDINESVTQNIFTFMRNVAKHEAINMSEEEIKDFSTKTASIVSTYIPGGNYEGFNPKDQISLLFNQATKESAKKIE
jgi:hypothetical protein